MMASEPNHDLIIVGAGTAGCVLAERLTDSGRLRVMLIEAGGPPTNRFVSIPAGFPRLFRSDLDWAFESEPLAAVGGRRVFTPRGKMLGGSSNLNALMHQWCHPADFDGWVADGATGWSWDEVAPVFRKQECWLGSDEDASRGRDGPMIISPNRNARPLTRAFVTAARNAGLGTQAQYNGQAYQGAWVAELTLKDGKRFSVFDAYLKPALSRKNLEVLTDAHATQVVIADKRAAGVKVLNGGSEQTFAARGVVLAAGAFGSPHVLMHSGIGPADVLADFGLTVCHDSPDVGANLQDHPLLPVVYRSRDTDTFKRAESPLNLLRYMLFKRGMLASNGAEGFAFTQVRPGTLSAPDLELLFVAFDARRDLLEPPREHAFGIAPVVIAPRSRGRVILRSNDPLVPLAIDFGLLSDPEGVDAAILFAGVQLSRKIASTTPLAELNLGEMRPGESVRGNGDILTYAGAELQTVYHPTSTCRMGSDERAVVDPQLRVRGIDSLWVADASVMPSVPRGHPNAAVAMIAERAAGWIESSLLK